MKLAAISHLASPSAPTGAEKSLAQLAGSLVQRGHETTVVVPGKWCLEGTVVGSGAGVVEIPSRGCWLVQAGEQPWWKQTLRYLRFRLPDPGTRRMMVFLDRFWPDVVHVNCLPQLKGAAAARALGLPVVWHVREILPPGRRRRWFAGRLRRDADTIVAVSQAVAEWLSEEGLSRTGSPWSTTGVRPRPTSEMSRSFGPNSGCRQRVRLSGSLPRSSATRAFSIWFRRAREPWPRGADLHVVIAGDGPPADKERLLAEIAGAVHPDRVHVLAPVDDVGKLLAAVDMVAVPSLWPDPLPRTVMEAMAAEKPVVAYDTGGVVGDGGGSRDGVHGEPRGRRRTCREDHAARRRCGTSTPLRRRRRSKGEKSVFLRPVRRFHGEDSQRNRGSSSTGAQRCRIEHGISHPTPGFNGFAPGVRGLQ